MAWPKGKPRGSGKSITRPGETTPALALQLAGLGTPAQRKRAEYEEQRLRIKDKGDPIGTLMKIAAGEKMKVDIIDKDGNIQEMSLRPTISQMLEAAGKLTDKIMPSLKAMDVEVSGGIDVNHIEEMSTSELAKIAKGGGHAIEADWEEGSN